MPEIKLLAWECSVWLPPLSSMLVHISLTVQRSFSPNSRTPKSTSFGPNQLGNLLKQLVVARIRDFGVEQLIRAQIAFDPRVADRCHGGLVERRTKQPRRTQQRDREKRLDLIHVSRSIRLQKLRRPMRAREC